MRLRTVMRGAVERVGIASGLAAISRRVNRQTVALLAYHNVVPASEAGRGDVSLHLPLPRFLEQLDRLEQTHDVVDLETALSGELGSRPRAVITFDDAYRGAITLALPELARRGLPAVVFIAPSLLGLDGTWWDELGEAGLLSPESRASALIDEAGRGSLIRSRTFGKSRPPTLPPSYGIATEEELREQCGRSLVIGSHTWAHEHLPSLTKADLRESLIRARNWLNETGLPTVNWLALPYGASSGQVLKSALECGHSHVLGIRGGVWRKSLGNRGKLVPRINVPAGVSVRGLELRASGLKR